MDDEPPRTTPAPYRLLNRETGATIQPNMLATSPDFSRLGAASKLDAHLAHRSPPQLMRTIDPNRFNRVLP